MVVGVGICFRILLTVHGPGVGSSSMGHALDEEVDASVGWRVAHAPSSDSISMSDSLASPIMSERAFEAKAGRGHAANRGSSKAFYLVRCIELAGVLATIIVFYAVGHDAGDKAHFVLAFVILLFELNSPSSALRISRKITSLLAENESRNANLINNAE